MSWQEILSLLLVVAAGLNFFFALGRAMVFASRHRDQLKSIGHKVAWWLLLFKSGSYGADVEDERRRLARIFGTSLIAFFVLVSILMILYAA